MFIIMLSNDAKADVRYLTNDPDAGLQMYGSSLQSAYIFNTFEEAENRFNKLLATKPSEYSGGMLYPPDFIGRGLDVSFANPKVSGILQIQEIVARTVRNVAVSGEIKYPTGHTYD